MKSFLNKKNSVYSLTLLFILQVYAAEYGKIRKFEELEHTFYLWDRGQEKRKIYRIISYKKGLIVGEVTDCKTDLVYKMTDSKAKKKIEYIEQELAKIKNSSTDKN